MAQPHTIIVPGAAYHITAVTYGRQRLFADSTNCWTVLEALAFQRTQGKIRLFAYVVMPDHLHWLIGVAEPHTPSAVVRDFKTFTAKAIRNHVFATHDSRLVAALAFAAVGRPHQTFKVWQDRPWIAPIAQDTALRVTVEYLHNNPVRTGIVETSIEYPWSSARAYAGLPGSFIEVDPLPI